MSGMVHFASRCPKRSTSPRRQEDRNVETQPVVKIIPQRSKRQETFNSASIENDSGIFAPTVYVNAKLKWKMHRAQFHAGSNVNIISEQTKKIYSLPMFIFDLNDTVLSATNDWFPIRSGNGRSDGISRHARQSRTVDIRVTYIAGKSNVDWLWLSVKAINVGHGKQYCQIDIYLENRKTRNPTSHCLRRGEWVSIPWT